MNTFITIFISSDEILCQKHYDDDHVGGVRLRLRTAVTNGPIVHPPGDI
jgi:hypothetical protein